MPNGDLRRRLLALLREADVEVQILEGQIVEGQDLESQDLEDQDPEGNDLVQGVQAAESDVILVDPSQIKATAVLAALGEVARDEEEPGIAIIGEDDPGKRARLLAAGFSGVLSAGQGGDQLAASVEALAEAEAAGGPRGPEVGGSGTQPRIADFLTRSPLMHEFVSLVQRVIEADTTLLILGATGVGKEHLARAIHADSPRHGGPFVAVNCAALPENLLEAELFGHTKGAFTGADGSRKGHFVLANGGSIFLDEIGDMPQHLQAKLLTVLQRHEITPVGAEQPQRIDVRVMVATNRDLRQMVTDGEFREDLYFRLNVVPLSIPPLRDRPEDIPELAGKFIQHFRSVMPNAGVEGISDRAIAALCSYAWPGNVRELINVVERGMLLCTKCSIDVEDLPEDVRGVAAQMHGVAGIAQGVASVSAVEESPGVPAAWQGRTLREVRDLVTAQAEKAYLRMVLQETGGHLGEAAKLVGLSARALYQKMKRYELRKEDFRGS
ncbi:MAG: transcriptional regulator with GAF, ATPase, and Fis domain [Planctomycetota bacterium]|jgi:transcriptional regulator with GAF, ATPase, and Fis domain